MNYDTTIPTVKSNRGTYDFNKTIKPQIKTGITNLNGQSFTFNATDFINKYDCEQDKIVHYFVKKKVVRTKIFKTLPYATAIGVVSNTTATL